MAAVAEHKFAQQLHHERVKTLYLQWKSLISGCAFVVVVTSAVLWNFVDKKTLIGWILANVLFLSLRSYNLSKELKNPPDPADSGASGQFGKTAIFRYRLFSLVNSLLWGTVPFFMFPENVTVLSISLLTHGGYIAAAVSVTASYDLKAFYAFVYPGTLLWVIGIIISGGNEFFGHAVLFGLYPFIMTVFAIRINNSFKEQILLRLENADLNSNLREQRDRAESAMQEKNRFLAAASHDLRQPVHAMGLFIASLEPYLSDKKPKLILGQIKQTSDNLGSLFHGLLDLSKLDANVVQNNPQHILLHPLLKTLSSEYQETAEQKHLTMKIDCSPTLSCYVDPSLLERILRNFISNSINYTQSGGISLSAYYTDNKQVTIQCKDTGKGIPANEQTKIFSEYHQLENPERDRKKGLGLGLAIVRRLSELMDVDVNLESEPGKGSTFSINLQAGDANKVLSPQKTSGRHEAMNYKVIVIDDEEDILLGMKSLLQSWGCTVTTATTGDEAIVALDAAPDMIIADFRLRNHESGLDSIERIRKHYRADILAVLITGDTAPERLQQAAHADVEVMHKPVKPNSLKKVFESLNT